MTSNDIASMYYAQHDSNGYTAVLITASFKKKSHSTNKEPF